MSDTLYAARQYVSVNHRELFSLAATSLVAAFCLTVRDLLFVRFGEIPPIIELLGTALAIFVIMLLALWVTKLIAVRVGYVIEYVPHKVGLIGGVILSIISLGYLPLFLPGGLRFELPPRLRVGKFRSWYKGWEVGLIAGAFPFVITFALLPLSALFLAGVPGMELLVVATWLVALFACLPLPMLGKHKGELKDFHDTVKKLRGSSFGLDVFYASGPWFLILCAYVLIIGILTWTLMTLGYPLGLWAYGFSVLFALMAGAVFMRFFQD